MDLKEKETWITPIKEYLIQETWPKGLSEAQKLLRKVPRYILQDDILYRRGFSAPLLRYMDKDKAKNVFENVHQGSYGDHTQGQSLTQKIL